MTESAAQLRRDAVARIAEIAGYDLDRLNVDLVLARGDSLQVLVRQALRKATGDQLLLEEIALLFPIGRGQAVALDDAIHQHGLPQPTPTSQAATDGPTMSLDELAQVLQETLK